MRGLNGDNGITKRQHVTQIMKQEGVDIMLLTETHVNHSSTETHNDFVFSSAVMSSLDKTVENMQGSGLSFTKS